ncbi:unnamed protein product [Owenia fusiformis]|uniref:Uncharacterized protein n=1 Tax=Owenia fusiformis TaxID=6347 RepID=A0A8J1YCC8_OWEFU|nr:unnamed protein product [Owenia fusiformis]
MDLIQCFTIAILWTIHVTTVVGQPGTHGLCATMSYRDMRLKQQNNHHCQMLENIQHEIMYTDKNERHRKHNQIMNVLLGLETKMNMLLDEGVHQVVFRPPPEVGTFVEMDDMPVLHDCSALLKFGLTTSGVYAVTTPTGHIINVYCDMDTKDGGWIVIQRRLNAKVSFDRNWDEYRNGFGDLHTSFWMGNEYIHLFTSNKTQRVRFDMWDWEGNTAYAEYDNFKVDSEMESYRIHISGYKGDAGDAINHYHDDIGFSTADKDNDNWYGNCGKRDKAGWWFRDCSYASPNGRYHDLEDPRGYHQTSFEDGIIWYHWKPDYTYSLKRIEIKMRPSE